MRTPNQDVRDRAMQAADERAEAMRELMARLFVPVRPVRGVRGSDKGPPVRPDANGASGHAFGGLLTIVAALAFAASVFGRADAPADDPYASLRERAVALRGESDARP